MPIQFQGSVFLEKFPNFCFRLNTSLRAIFADADAMARAPFFQRRAIILGGERFIDDDSGGFAA